MTKAEPPRELTREHRRRINAQIEEVYLKDSYAPGWSDNRVALELGVPRAWVSTLRDEGFGPSGVSEEMVAFQRDAEEYLAGAKTAIDEARKLHDEVVLFCKEWESRAKALGLGLERIAKLEELATRIRKGGAI